MFDNGSEITLVSSIFAKKNRLPYEEASYTLAGIGSSPTTYNNGRIYNIPLLDTKPEIIYVKAFSVETILSEKIGQEAVKFSKEDFPHLPKEVLQEAAKPLAKKHMNILIGNPDLGLQLACESGFGCMDCAKGRCLFKSKFGSGYVPLGSFGKDQSLVSAIKHVALNKVSPPLQGLFFQGEALRVSPVERCTHCKVNLAECRICSSETALLTAQE